LFLDEPTIGLDTQSRKRIWSYIKKVNGEEGVTVLLTTHYMDEADQNSDVICIIDKGKIMANGTPESLKKALKNDRIEIQTNGDDRACELIKSLAFVSHVQDLSVGLEVGLKEDSGSITNLIDLLRKNDIEIINIASVKPTLDDVFIHYTGRGLNEFNHENFGSET
jgi:ABC-2 type transport system ATP-binding protein